MTDTGKGRVLGIGGIFFRSADLPPAAFTVWSAFAADTAYFGNSSQSYMINLVVDDLDAALARVAVGGATVLEEREEHDFGRFGWFIDPDGHRVELWEPPEAE
ncbi:MAG: VOC family protein [Lysobacterales bacterium]|nr:MAG: VOC family protein [Xanthomonadales bacterium]